MRIISLINLADKRQYVIHVVAKLVDGYIYSMSKIENERHFPTYDHSYKRGGAGNQYTKPSSIRRMVIYFKEIKNLESYPLLDNNDDVILENKTKNISNKRPRIK